MPQERLRKLTEENKELAANLKKDMDVQRRAATGKPTPAPPAAANKRRGGDLTGSSARGSEDRSSAVPPPGPRGTKRGREIEGIDKVCLNLISIISLRGFWEGAGDRGVYSGGYEGGGGLPIC